MISTELIVGLLSLFGSGIMTMWAQRSADLAEERRYRSAQSAATEASTEAARSHSAKWTGFYWIRGAIALIVIFYFFFWPSFPAIVAAFSGDPIQVVVGYYDTTDGFWPWQVSMESIHWVKTGSSDPNAVVSVFSPVQNTALIAIVGFFFGNQVTRRA